MSLTWEIQDLRKKLKALELKVGTGGTGSATFEGLLAAGDVGIGSDQVAQGDHKHSYTVVETAVNYTVLNKNTLVICTQPVIITLPNIVTSSINVIIVNLSTGEILVNSDVSDTVENDTSLTIMFTKSSASLMSSITTNNWNII